MRTPSLESYSHVSAEGQRGGYAVDLVREALRRIDCAPRFVDVPSARAWQSLANGEIDLLFGARPTLERQAEAHFSRPVDFVGLVLFGRAELPERHRIQGLEDVRGTRLRIGVEQRTVYSPEYDALQRDPAFRERLRVIVDRERGWQMVEAGRLDAIFADEASALRHGFRPGGGGRIEPLVHLTPVPFHIAASRRTVDASTFERFDSALEAMSRDGTLVRLKERHVPCRISPQTLSCLGPLAAAEP